MEKQSYNIKKEKKKSTNHRAANIFVKDIFRQISGMEREHMSTYSMKNLPSISVQLTATSAMGILKHWAIYKSSTSKALGQRRQRGTAAVQQLR